MAVRPVLAAPCVPAGSEPRRSGRARSKANPTARGRAPRRPECRRRASGALRARAAEQERTVGAPEAERIAEHVAQAAMAIFGQIVQFEARIALGDVQATG